MAGRLVLWTTHARPRRAKGLYALKFYCSSRSAAALSPVSGGLPVLTPNRIGPTTRFRTIQGCPKDLGALPGHPEPAVSWHSGFRGGAHARPKTTPVDHAAQRRGCIGVAARGACAAGKSHFSGFPWLRCETANPFAFWAQAARLAWFPWLAAAHAVMVPPSPAPPRAGAGSG
jgi:hypothetical protein